MAIEWRHTSHEEDRWYAIYTKSRSEKKVGERLADKEIEVFVPLRRQLRTWSDRKKWVELPVFPSYIFVKISSRQFQQIIETDGVYKFVHFSGRIVPIPDRQVNSIKLLLLSGVDFTVEPITHDFSTGEKVVVKSGVLKGVAGEVLQLRGKKKVAILVEQLGMAITVEVEAKHLETDTAEKQE